MYLRTPILKNICEKLLLSLFYLKEEQELQSWTKHFVCLHHLSETELDYYHQKGNVRVASRVVERLKTKDLSKLGNFKEIPEMLGFDGEYPAVHLKAKFWRFLVNNCKKEL